MKVAALARHTAHNVHDHFDHTRRTKSMPLSIYACACPKSVSAFVFLWMRLFGAASRDASHLSLSAYLMSECVNVSHSFIRHGRTHTNTHKRNNHTSSKPPNKTIIQLGIMRFGINQVTANKLTWSCPDIASFICCFLLALVKDRTIESGIM